MTARSQSDLDITPTPHIEQHFTAGEVIRDIVIGMSDGLTVPFALAAGLSGAIDSTAIVVTAGLAEVAAGSVAMGLGGYLAAKNDAEHYAGERTREEREVRDLPDRERQEVADVLKRYGLTDDEIAPITRSLSQRPKDWVDFMMRFELGLEAPDPKRAIYSAVTIAGAYVAGGLIPLAPYMLLNQTTTALPMSIAVTLLALFGFGFTRGRFTGTPALKSALSTTVIGGIAAAVAFTIARMIA